MGRVALRQRSISLRVPAPFMMGLRRYVWATNTQRMRTIALTGETWALSGRQSLERRRL